jgi:hypothetical protein
MASLEGVYAVIDGMRYQAEDFLDPEHVQSADTENGVTVVLMDTGEEYFFSETSLRRREAGENQIPRPFTPNISGTPAESEKKTRMANLTVLRKATINSEFDQNLAMSLQEAFVGEQRLLNWAETQDFSDEASFEEIFDQMRKIPDLTEGENAILKDFDNDFGGDKKSPEPSNGNPDDPFAESTAFNEGSGGGGGEEKEPPKSKTQRKHLSPEEQAALQAEHAREVANIEGARSEEDTQFLVLLKSYLTPYHYLPIVEPVTRNNGRLSAKLVNKIPQSKRQFASGVSQSVRAEMGNSAIPAHLAAAEYDIVWFESNPGPTMGVLAYLPRNFEPAVLETLTTDVSKSKIKGWANVEGAAKEIILRWISKEELLNIMVATAAPAVMVEQGKFTERSLKNLEFFFTRKYDSETGNTWYNIIARDSVSGKARKGTSAGYIPLNTFVQEAAKDVNIQMVSNQILGGPLFNKIKEGKGIETRYEELTDAAKSMLTGNSRETFVLKDLKKSEGIKAISHRNRKDAPEEVVLKPARVEKYTTSEGAEKTRFVKENFLKYLENPTGSAFEKDFTAKVREHSSLLQEAQKRRAKTSQSSMLEQKNTMQATNDLLEGRLPQLGKKKKV